MQIISRLSGFLFIVNLIVNLPVTAQTLISGYVFDAQTKQPVENVNIYAEGQASGTVSKTDGRYELPFSDLTSTIIFSHISYQTKKIPIEILLKNSTIVLQPTDIRLHELVVSDTSYSIKMDSEVPASRDLISLKNISNLNPIPIANLLNKTHYIVSDEKLTGNQTISMRGGNANETLILVNGIKINSSYTNEADVSLLDVSSFSEIEIIKGNATSTYGSGAFSGMMNFKPQYSLSHYASFKQSFASYNTGTYNIQVFPRYEGVKSTLSFSQSASDIPVFDNTANIQKDKQMIQTFVSGWDNHIEFTGIFSTSDFYNSGTEDRYKKDQQIAGVQISNPFNVPFYLNSYVITEGSRFSYLDTDFNTLAFEYDEVTAATLADYILEMDILNIMVGSQIESTELSSQNQTITGFKTNLPTDLKLNRTKLGGYLLFKTNNPSGSLNVGSLNADLSFRYDYVKDKTRDNGLAGFIKDDTYQRGSAKIGLDVKGYINHAVLRTYLTASSNLKFPSLFQKSNFVYQAYDSTSIPSPLKPEINESFELGFELELNSFLPLISVSYFVNKYQNKIITINRFGSPIADYEFSELASLSGIELNGQIDIIPNQFTITNGFSKYFYSDIRVFPQKPSHKNVMSVFAYQKYVNMVIDWIVEGETLIIQNSVIGIQRETKLDAYSDFNLSLSNTTSFFGAELTSSFSVLNLLNNRKTIEGILLRDRQFNLSLQIIY